MKTFTRLTAAALLAALIGAVTAACSSGPAATTSSPAVSTSSPAVTTSSPAVTTSSPATTAGQLDEAAVRAFADEATQVTLEGLSEHDLAKFTSRADAAFKAALTETTFESGAATIEQQLGTFQKATYQSWEMSGGYIAVHYKVTYTKGTVGVRMVFDSDHLVAGQWFE
jgi:membrane-bound lytic murein transglycosylase B